MSSLWTPGGEVPVGPERGGGRRPASPPPGPEAMPPGAEAMAPGGEPLSPEDEERARAMAEQLAEAQRRLAEVPAAVVVANHVMGLFELGAIHLNQQPPNLDEARVAIDAMGAVLDALRGRLGQDEATLRSALDQIRLAFVQLRERAEEQRAQAGGGDAPPPAP